MFPYVQNKFQKLIFVSLEPKVLCKPTILLASLSNNNKNIELSPFYAQIHRFSLTDIMHLVVGMLLHRVTYTKGAMWKSNVCIITNLI